ncbi:beta-1,3-galactosyltransferase GALT1-like [Canna indica]|uniref:Beta-1,3-galactosyltransferase GALT1-like n=1 Tax=Canna indica TaxID=4628 RepID=A0AAQ3JVD6_9LILI|nr:beta-1,3-galactosyltransferase GALT1-like [Canna indica]
MKKWYSGVVLVFLFCLLLLRFGILENPLVERSLQRPLVETTVSTNSSDHLYLLHPEDPSVVRNPSANSSDHLYLLHPEDPPVVHNPENGSQIISTGIMVSKLFCPRNLSDSELRSLQTWNYLEHLVNISKALPNAVEAMREAEAAWESLMTSVEEEKLIGSRNGTAKPKAKEKLCPYSIRRMNASEFNYDGFKLLFPCGLVQGSSITIIGTPSGLIGDFRIDLRGAELPGEPDPPIILHYNVRLSGDQITEDPVIVQNTWTPADDWGEEERCPIPDAEDNGKVDDLEKCNSMVGKYTEIVTSNNPYSFSKRSLIPKVATKSRRYFPFRQGHLVIATIRMGLKGIQMSVDGKHITSFAYRDGLEPWLVNEVSILGDLQLISVLASGLPTLEDLEHVMDLDILKSTPVPNHKAVDLFIGVFSTANNFKQRMAVRRTWKQYEAVRAGSVAVRFFVGLHKNQMVNEELWSEARAYGDIQLMPFVDYYTLITWKTLAICIYGTKILSAKYIMKTDDDAFVRVDELLASLKRENVTHGLLFGRINLESQPERDPESKWYITPQEWPEEKYPPWAHGPGYVVSRDIAKTVYKKYKKGRLKMFKLEDVAMGIWIEEMKKEGVHINYVNEMRIHSDGCGNGYMVAHYQEPRELLCLWQKLHENHQPICCEL